MKKHGFLAVLAVLSVFLVSGCTSPTFYMPPEQLRSLSDDEICAYKNGYREEAQLEAEIARRDLNCNRYYRECLARGNKPESEAMRFCMDVLRENERLRYESQFGHYDRYHGRGGLYSGVGFGF